MRTIALILAAVMMAGCSLLPGDEPTADNAAAFATIRATYTAHEDAARADIRSWGGDAEVASAAYARLAANTRDLRTKLEQLPGSSDAIEAAVKLADLQSRMAEGDVELWTSRADEYHTTRANLESKLDALATTLGVTGEPSASQTARVACDASILDGLQQRMASQEHFRLIGGGGLLTVSWLAPDRTDYVSGTTHEITIGNERWVSDGVTIPLEDGAQPVANPFEQVDASEPSGLESLWNSLTAGDGEVKAEQDAEGCTVTTDLAQGTAVIKLDERGLLQSLTTSGFETTVDYDTVPVIEAPSDTEASVSPAASPTAAALSNECGPGMLDGAYARLLKEPHYILNADTTFGLVEYAYLAPDRWITTTSYDDTVVAEYLIIGDEYWSRSELSEGEWVPSETKPSDALMAAGLFPTDASTRSSLDDVSFAVEDDECVMRDSTDREMRWTLDGLLLKISSAELQLVTDYQTVPAIDPPQ